MDEREVQAEAGRDPVGDANQRETKEVLPRFRDDRVDGALHGHIGQRCRGPILTPDVPVVRTIPRAFSGWLSRPSISRCDYRLTRLMSAYRIGLESGLSTAGSLPCNVRRQGGHRRRVRERGVEV